jgi:hypothetical protein
MRTLAWILLVIMASAGVCQAQDDTATTTPKTKFLPIEIQTFGWGKYSSNGFYYDGLPLQSYRQFEKVIDPLGDPQASQLIHSADNNDAWGQPLLWGGAVVWAAGLTDFVIQMANIGNTTTTTDQYGDTITVPANTDVGLAVAIWGAGTVACVVGFILESDAGNDRYNAVNRYNYQVQHDNGLSLMMLPNTHQPGLAFTQRF